MRHFFALFSRMKHLDRWALMRNVSRENLSSHSLDVAAIAHALALIGNRRLGKVYDANFAAALGIYHDMPEILTGDLPTPVKYYNGEIRGAYAQIERAAENALLGTLPDDLRDDYRPLLQPDPAAGEYKLMKAADKIAALIKCVEEKNGGNREFILAEESTRRAIEDLHCEEADIFLDEFLGSYEQVLDNILK
ncbi:MAG: 5'-deoxynucleotidase [Clostridia bacterium]|nr:5'-deoxynucleotidase [Clostridia bacterium]